MMSQFAQESIDRCLDFLIEIGNGEAGLFYCVNADMHSNSFTLRAIDVQIQKNYKSHFYRLDPLQARHYGLSRLNLVSFDRIPAHLQRQTDIFLNEFLIPAGYHHALEVFFRSHERIVAGVSLLRHEADHPFSGRDLALLERAREFAEFRLLHENPAMALGGGIEPLTARETDIFALLCSGNSNEEIAFELAIAPSTVKTHLKNIYGKFGAGNRKDLLIKLLGRTSPRV